MSDETAQEEVGEVDDDNFVVDMDSVEDLKFEAIPAGSYDCVISEVEYKRSQSSNKPMWEIRPEIVGGEYAGRKLWFYASFSENALPGTKIMIGNIAPQLLEQPLQPKKVAEEGTLLGIRCKAKVKIEIYQGEKKNRVERLLPPSEGNEFMGD